MSSPFSQTTRALAGDTHKLTKVLAFLGLLAAALWFSWFLGGSVPVHETASARVVIRNDPYPVSPVRDGRVRRHQLGLNREVAKGDPLVELDDTQASMNRAAEEARMRQLARRDDQVRIELEALAELVAQREKTASLQLEEARIEARRQETQVALLEDSLARSKTLYERGELAELAYLREESELEEAGQKLQLLEVKVQRHLAEHRETQREQARERIKLEGERDSIASELQASKANLGRLEHEQDQFVVRAPASGILVEVSNLSEGAFVESGQVLGSLLVEEKLTVRAWFDPASSLGKLHPGDPATMRLQGFPWVQYGQLTLSVTNVAGERRNGLIRVDFRVDDAPAAIHLQHGMPGQVIVTTEQVSPFTLLLRTIGGVGPGSARANLSAPTEATP
ncbi:HlyD family efflux transporter periplasmic adaptor subunit [Sulfidibacter corallicola]|uniref:HlyD family efflux transporter periplasmic adaptor subunit n=1 Tax=Sulfidibacter corallicola TaxID=2818388 RepID=A0A8A4TPZ2_SULCO|nr:HlyD family efflux transporter periplasmic adaptor subunit [Sulfidibacter corallicola]QTD51152.1 HlyD family efflux transporter periplasmic adaptor subunit [Sulfidibacter corallicola]